MTVPLGNLGSGIDTETIINQLMEVEARPLRQIQIEINESRNRRAALEQLGEVLRRLDESARDLHGHRAAFDEKIATSSNPGIVEVRAGRTADPGTRRVEVVQLVSTHRISSDRFEPNHILSDGRFTIIVDGESQDVNFRGGRLSALAERIEEEANHLVSAIMVRADANNYVMILESKIRGERGKISITGDENFLKETGLNLVRINEDDTENNIVFSDRHIHKYSGRENPTNLDGSSHVLGSGRSLNVRGTMWSEFELPVSQSVHPQTILEFNMIYTEAPAVDNGPSDIMLGPDGKINIKGVELQGYNVTRVNPVTPKDRSMFDSIAGIGIISMDSPGNRIERRYPIADTSIESHSIPIGRDFAGRRINRIFFYCNDGSTTFSDVRILNEADSGLAWKNEIAKAEDAIMKIDGIQVSRDRNTELDDVIRGVSLDLRRASSEIVEIRIENDIDKAIAQIRRFVDAFNFYIDFNRDLVRTGTEVDGPGDGQPGVRGPFAGDMSIIQIESVIKRVVNGAYPNLAENQIRILPQMGINTGRINASWENIRLGKLIIEEDELRRVLTENAEGVKAFFGADTTGDSRVNTGMAFTLEETLKQYVGFGRNLIVIKIDSEDETIRRSNERIARKQEQLKAHEDRLRIRFGRMERAVSQSKNQRNWMEQNMRQDR